MVDACEGGHFVAAEQLMHDRWTHDPSAVMGAMGGDAGKETVPLRLAQRGAYVTDEVVEAAQEYGNGRVLALLLASRFSNVDDGNGNGDGGYGSGGGGGGGGGDGGRGGTCGGGYYSDDNGGRGGTP